MKKKSTIIVAVVIAALALAVAVLALLHGRDTARQKQLQTDAVFLLHVGEAPNGRTYEITAAELEAMGPEEVQANYKKSGKAPEARVFRGVPFAALLQKKGIGTAEAQTVSFSAADGYASALPIEEALDAQNCFIVLDSGEEGPFRMILAKDQFSQRWCKLLTEITLG